MKTQILLGISMIISLITNLPGILTGLTCGLCIFLIGKLLKNKKIAKLGFNQLIAQDQVGNAATGGDPDETISSRMGKWSRDGKNDHGLKKPLYKVANFIVELFEKDHFKKSIEEDEGRNETIK